LITLLKRVLNRLKIGLVLVERLLWGPQR